MNKIVKLLVAMGLAVFCASASAIPTTLEGNGIIWTFDGAIDSADSSTASFTLSADVSGQTLGSDTYFLSDFSLKNFGSTATISNLVSPAGTWDWQNSGLNANGCKDNSTADALCVFNTSDFYDAPNTDADFSFNFDISLDAGDIFPELAHFKVRWVQGNDDGTFNKVGDLISQDFAWNPCTVDCGPGTDVPEPAMAGLLAIGLFGVVIARRRASV